MNASTSCEHDSGQIPKNGRTVKNSTSQLITPTAVQYVPVASLSKKPENNGSTKAMFLTSTGSKSLAKFPRYSSTPNNPKMCFMFANKFCILCFVFFFVCLDIGEALCLLDKKVAKFWDKTLFSEKKIGSYIYMGIQACLVLVEAVMGMMALTENSWIIMFSIGFAAYICLIKFMVLNLAIGPLIVMGNAIIGFYVFIFVLNAFHLLLFYMAGFFMSTLQHKFHTTTFHWQGLPEDNCHILYIWWAYMGTRGVKGGAPPYSPKTTPPLRTYLM